MPTADLRAVAQRAVAAYEVVEDWLVIDTELAGGAHLADGARFVLAMRELRALLRALEAARA